MKLYRSYDEVKGGVIPRQVEFDVLLSGGSRIVQRHKYAIRYHMTPGFLELEDMGGAGVIQKIERGIIRRIEIYAAAEAEATA